MLTHIPKRNIPHIQHTKRKAIRKRKLRVGLGNVLHGFPTVLFHGYNYDLLWFMKMWTVGNRGLSNLERTGAWLVWPHPLSLTFCLLRSHVKILF